MNDPRNLRFFFDLTDPASFLMNRRLSPMEGAGTLLLVHEPFERLPPPLPRPLPDDADWQPDWEVWRRRAQALGTHLEPPALVPWSRKAHELVAEAEQKGCFRDVLDTLFRAYFSDGMDIGRVDVLVELGRRVGLDPRETKAALDVDLHRDSVLKKRREAEQIGVARSPTLVWLGRVLEGYPDDEKLTNFLAP